MIENKRKMGTYYEGSAIKYLEDLGYRLIEKNYWTEHGEIDLVLVKDAVYYFVEVKYRSSDAYGSPRQAITYKKKTSMKKTALHFLKTNCDVYQAFAISFLGITKDGKVLNYDFLENIFD